MNLIFAVLILSAVPLPVSAREIPTHGPFRTLAWCKDFTLGTRPSDRKDREGDGYDLWMQMPDSGPGGAGKEFRIDPIPFPGAKGGNLSIDLWETKTGKVVVPERVKTINRFATARWNPDPDKKLLSKEDAAAEELHYVFLADLRQRFADSDRMIPRGKLEQEARARFDRYRKADRQGTAKGVMHGEARDVVDGQRELLLRASLKEGAVASLGDPN
jgi:hypothetical protein